MSAIKITDLSKFFGSFEAVSDLDLEIGERTIFGFLGPNGAGKTTTIRMMVGLIKPSKGGIEISDAAIKFGESRNHVLFGYLPEQPSFYGWMTGAEYLNFVAELFRIRSEEKARRVKDLISQVDLEDARNKKISSYSNGMKQRLGIAQALINDPGVLILDEPVSALDPIGRKEVLSVIEQLGKSKTVFMSTHILADVDRICSEVAIINHGKLIITSSLPELKEKYAAPILRIEFNGDPQEMVPELEQTDWAKKVEKNGNQIKIWLKNLKVMDSNTPLQLITKYNIGVLNYGLALPETEDLFVEIVGEQS